MWPEDWPLTPFCLFAWNAPQWEALFSRLVRGRTRLVFATAEMAAGELVGLGPVKALTQLVKTDGPRVLVKGSGVNCVKVSLGNSIGFVLYELMKDLLRVDGRTPPWANKAADADE